MASSSSSSSSSSSLASHRLKYDVFLNFRGEDTRRGFTSHLYDALSRKALQIFFDDDLKRGEEITQSLLQAIQESAIAVLVFSKDYASSKWCLDELAKIIDCHHSHRQIVIPVFYEVDPSHLRNQCHDVGAAFVKHEQNFVNADKIKRWKKALTIAASLSGFDFKNFRNDVMLIEKIVEDILKKVKQPMTCGHLVGMNSRIEEIIRLFTIDPCKINILGICGMGGVGKTTTAEAIYDNMSPGFEGRCFIENVRQRAEAIGLRNLLEELVSKALGKENPDKNMSSGQLRLSLKKILWHKKMLIFLDDVNDPQQLEYLIGDVNDPVQVEYLIGHPISAGSMILITGRNKQVFGGRNAFMYEVEPLNSYDALHLFSKCAFKQNYPRDDYASLSKSFVTYAQGNPLALKVLGSALIGKRKGEWESALHQLSTVSNKDIHHVLQISYDSLNRVEQDLFLDIACFFGQIYVDQETLRKIYESIGFDITLSVLVDRCLVTSNDSLNMHDLLQEMGKEIVRRKAKNSRLWDPQDIYEVFVGNKEAEGVETITLDLSKITEINLNPQVLTKMRKLRFLNFYGESNLHLSQGLDYLPNTLQYLRWDKYPLESLPPNFQPKNLVVLELSNSNIKQFWKKAQEDSLVSNVKHGIVNGFWRLTSLHLVQNKSITQLPKDRSGFLETLEVLDLRSCSNLNTFPDISSNIKRLYLDKTAIRQIPSSSVERLSKLQSLYMEDCRELESLPSNFFSKLTSLKTLDLSKCSRLKVLPKILEPMRYMELLSLRETAIEKLPSFIDFRNKRRVIHMGNCSKLAFHPRSCFLEDFILAESLHLPNCKLRELPEDLSFLSFVSDLNLSNNDFERIPPTFKQLPQLKILQINSCESLLSLPELPSNVYMILACHCSSLKEIRTLKQLPLNSRIADYKFDFYNCSKLDEDECQEVVNALLRNYTRNQKQKTLVRFEMVYPGSRIPKWVKYQDEGDSIQIHFPSHWFNHLFLGFAFYLALDFDLDLDLDRDRRRHFYKIRYDCYFGDKYHFSFDDSKRPYTRRIYRKHMIVFVNTKFCQWVRSHSDFEEDKAIFKLTIDYFDCEPITNGIKNWGVIPLYAQKDEDEFCGTFDFPNLGVSKLTRSVTAEGSFHCMPQKSLKIEEIE